MHHDAMNMVRSGLRARIDALAAQGGTITLPRICEQIDIIRHDARAYGLEPLERIASTLESALARHGLGPVILSYLDIMRDAVECEDSSPEASTTYLAALSLRIGH
ncbi:MAG: hypothetical protein KA533_09525 [Sphingobium sp.]|nr:hypothetical protein [Sphingobium sp.]MBP6111957.1 hypothetical protein [Sphingobium sp.]MBP8671057.1 hypothetical protein [Sphingobium sp.]MBP9158736.1 hypothetical protein [Sphingobium sp.]MCC6481112.1 hypothetical protein [Sphingomonadaceae bacterium]